MFSELWTVQCKIIHGTHLAKIWSSRKEWWCGEPTRFCEDQKTEILQETHVSSQLVATTSYLAYSCH